MDEPIQDVQEVETPAESSPVEENTVEVPETESELAETPQEAEAEGVANVPLHENPRFKEVIEEKNYWKEQAMRVQGSQVQAQPQPLDEPIPANLIDAEGNVDPVGYQKWVMNQARLGASEETRRLIARDRAEQIAWQEAEKSYPSLREDPELRDLVERQQKGSVLHGELLTPKQVADRIFKRFKVAEQTGIKKAQVSESIQKVATQEVGGTTVKQNPANTAYQKGIDTGDWNDYIKATVLTHIKD